MTVTVTNDGQRVLSTNYWSTPHAARGLLWLSWNAGALRVLIPPAAEHLLQELPPPGTPVTYHQRQATRTLLYEDDPEQPYAVEVDARQCDRTLPPSDDGKVASLLWYGQEGEQGVRLLREERLTIRIHAPAQRPEQPVAIITPACALQVFSLDASGVPTPVPETLYWDALELLARDPMAEWVPQPTGPYAQASRAGRPPGTASWHCMLAAPSSGDVMVRLLWAGDSLATALQGLEDAFWRTVPRSFVVAAMIAARLGRTCRSAEGPIAAAAVPWNADTPPPQPPPPLSRKRLEEMAEECLQKLLQRTALPVPERGTDAYRFLAQLGGLVWREENARRLAQVYNGATEAPAVLVHAVGLHAFLHHPVQVAIGDIAVTGADLHASDELWAQWAEWLLCNVPAEFVQWVHPDGLYRVSDLLEPRQDSIPDPQTSMALERALLEDAERSARYVPYGAFILQVPEELFLYGWGVRELWLWVDGRRVWCAVAGEDGLPRESFCWEAGRGVLSNLVVPLPAAPALSAVLAAVWRDLVVAGEEAAPARSAGAERQRRASTATVAAPQSPRVAVFPRRQTRTFTVSGYRLWGTEEDRKAARQAHTVRGHLRRLAPGRRTSAKAAAAAAEHGIIVPVGSTFVRPHVRGRSGRQLQRAPAQPAFAIAKGLRSVAVVLQPLRRPDGSAGSG